MPGSKISNAPPNNSFATSFLHLKLRRGHKEDYMETGKSKAGIGSDEGGYVLVGGVRKGGSLIRVPQAVLCSSFSA